MGICTISFQSIINHPLLPLKPDPRFPSSQIQTPTPSHRKNSDRLCWILSLLWMNLQRKLTLPRYVRFYAPCFPSKSIGKNQPSLMNFCVTDGESVVATRYISSREDEAASLVSDDHVIYQTSHNWLAIDSGIPRERHSVNMLKVGTTRCRKLTKEKTSSW